MLSGLLEAAEYLERVKQAEHKHREAAPTTDLAALSLKLAGQSERRRFLEEETLNVEPGDDLFGVWLCSACNTVNPAEAQICCKSSCCRKRSLFGVNPNKRTRKHQRIAHDDSTLSSHRSRTSLRGIASERPTRLSLPSEPPEVLRAEPWAGPSSATLVLPLLEAIIVRIDPLGGISSFTGGQQNDPDGPNVLLARTLMRDALSQQRDPSE